MSVRVYVTVCMKVERYVCHYVCINVCMVACIYVCLRSIQNLLVFPRMTQSRTAAGGASVSGVRPPSIFAAISTTIMGALALQWLGPPFQPFVFE